VLRNANNNRTHFLPVEAHCVNSWAAQRTGKGVYMRVFNKEHLGLLPSNG
jgi:hypothetical protein